MYLVSYLIPLYAMGLVVNVGITVIYSGREKQFSITCIMQSSCDIPSVLPLALYTKIYHPILETIKSGKCLSIFVRIDIICFETLGMEMKMNL